MAKIKYINYLDLKEFYTIAELCELFEMSKDELKQKCKQYDVQPRRNEIGEFGFVKYDVRKLHNFIWKEDKSGGEEDPWA